MTQIVADLRSGELIDWMLAAQSVHLRAINCIADSACKRLALRSCEARTERLVIFFR